uniref:Calmodulin binding transcription activator 2 n=1 Tax=Vombatus ursinus TaxID=29139 RepID=A0A4X2JQW9_VOMUR
MNNKDTTEVAENSHHLKIFLPKKLLECLPRCPLLPPERLRWNTNEEIASYLITFEKHDEWLSCSPKTRPQNGSIILYNRKKVKYRKDGYCWKKRKDGKTTREDHMKLKVQGMEVGEALYGCEPLLLLLTLIPGYPIAKKHLYLILTCDKASGLIQVSGLLVGVISIRKTDILLPPPLSSLAHEAGLVSLQVAGEGGPLSASVLFEYRARRFLALPSTQLDWLSLDDNQFRMSILERLEQMEKRMAEMAAAGQAPPPGPDPHPVQGGVPGPGFEARVVVLVERMIPRYGWRGPDHLVHGGPFRGMSLLHLAAAQGYARLIETLSQWRTMEAESLDLEQEVDPLNVDHFSCTPLMWACALGHLEAAVLLFRWNQQALNIPDSLGRLPLAVAHSRGHVQLARCLEELQRQEASVEPLPAPSPPSASPDTGLSSVSSPSELSDGTFSVTSAYSSAPDSSPPPASLPTSEGTTEVTQPGQSPHGLSEASNLLMDYKASNPKGLPSPHSVSEDSTVDVDMISLAKQIVEATPERIKQEDFGSVPEAGGPLQEQTGAMGLSETMSWLASYLENVDHLPNLTQHSELPFERGRLAAPPAPSWAEFLGASANGKMESDFALLTLSDHEQRELYEAGRVIQTPFRKYKGRRLKEQQEMAAAVIQRCYRKYKQFALYKKMTQAAILIQSKFRSYYEQKRFQQSRRAAVLIQQHYRSYRCRPGPCHRPPGPSGPLPPRSKGSFLTKKQDQAARKIMRFLRRCQHRMKELKQSQELEGLSQPELAT